MSIITFATDQGPRQYQEDTLLWSQPPEGTLIGVFDGHGSDVVAKILAKNMARWWSAVVGGLSYPLALEKVFQGAESVTHDCQAGSTASVVFIPTDESVAHIAVLGDSPVLAERADGSIFVGPDHNARSNQEERSTAIARGGIYLNGYIWNDYSDLGVGLQMTRALGDFQMGNILNRTPEITTIELGSFLVVGSDGLFDPKHESRESFDDVLACIRNENTATDIVRQVLATSVNDNVTAILWRRK